MTTEAITLIHQLSTPQDALRYLNEQGYDIPDDAFEHIIDFHLGSEGAVLERFRQRDWLWLHSELARLLTKWIDELPDDIGEHRLTRIDLEGKAQKIRLLRKFVSVIVRRIPNH